MNFTIGRLIIFLCISHKYNASSEKTTVDYYVNLMEEEMARTFTYKIPTDSSEFKPSSNDTLGYGIYDYIIVGAGSTGAVLANRLSETGCNKVLLLEAGGPESDFTDIPAMCLYLQRLQYNWNYNSTPQTTSCLGMLNHECPYPRGRGLGGSSIINGLMYVRGNKDDYNNWWKQGNPGWSYKEVLPYFMKSENSNIDDGDNGYHGVGGNLNVEKRKNESPQLQAFYKANLELGREILDYNGKNQLGAGKTQFNTIRGFRDSTGRAFLKPAMNRSNLKVLTHSLVVKVLINPKTKAAYGVLFMHDRHTFKAIARKEVIVSAGAIGSPQLLMLSGIGPRDHLEKLGISVIQSLAVGNNLQDHAAYTALNVKTNYTKPKRTLEQTVKDLLNGDGRLTYAIPSEGVGFYQTNLTNVSGVPDIEFMFLPVDGLSTASDIFRRVSNYNEVSYATTWETIDLNSTLAFYIILLHPKSRGRVMLKSKNPFAYPLIDTRFLSDPDGLDIETIYQGIELALEMIDTEAFRKLNATLVYAPLPACKGFTYLSREYWYCQLRQLTVNIYHPVGTCKMGPDPNAGAVVNHELKVHGIKNLRVADASIMPDAISGHLNAPCIMIGEKLADIIIHENNM